MSARESSIRAHAQRTGTRPVRESSEDERQEHQEQRNLRRLQVMMQYLLASIAQDRSLTVDDAAQLVAHTRNAVLRMFPGKESAFDLLCRPRIQRAMRERFHIQ